MAKSVRPCRVRQQPPEVRCWTLTGLHAGRVAPAHCCAAAPSEPGVPFSPHPAQASPEGSRAVQKCWAAAPCALSAWWQWVWMRRRTVIVRSCRVSRTVIAVRRIALRVRGEPLFPFVGACGSWSACSRRSPQSGQRPCCAWSSRRPMSVQRRGLAVRRRVGPVLGQGRVVRGRPALDQLVPDDLRPGELEQVGAAVAVAEHPPVLPGRVERAEVPVDDPVLRLVRVAVLGPLVGELPHVVVQRVEHLAGHHRPVVGRPTPDDRVEPVEHRRGVGPAQGPHLGARAVPGSVSRPPCSV